MEAEHVYLVISTPEQESLDKGCQTYGPEVRIPCVLKLVWPVM